MPVATPTYSWSPQQSVQVTELDQQHKKLFDTMNELAAILRAGASNLTIDPILDKLVDYAITHFACEEQLMEKHGFPGLMEHRQAHANFREKIAGFVIEHKAGQPGIPQDLLSYMNTWLENHLSGMDQDYVPYMNGAH